MADRKVTVLNPSGYQEQLPDSDNLLVSATPTANLHAVNKLYVDTKVADVDLSSVEADINAISNRVTVVEGNITTIQQDINAIETTYATKEYVDGDVTNLQNQIDAIVAQGNIQNLQDVTDLGNTTNNDIVCYGNISAATLTGDIDQGEY